MNKEEKELYGFIVKNHPGYDGILLCKTTKTNTLGEQSSTYYCIEKHKCANGTIFTINGHYWSEYSFIFDEGEPELQIIFKQA